ncbi:hypothetical protein E1180_12730 [Roseibium denhamense]|uniref:Uncharacterized protein n=1 Tax=Roseibium denhamense TaxID=76305 RepID=A0ABY1NFW4_9HYPH|nr:hypothetical protein [Roseibium denhamense]MTI06381.1 hypothetical protein [Roseibium denhamense]SMP08677.1 hypothetical protein SAMN06265374_1010 [Roseibium denhamense]
MQDFALTPTVATALFVLACLAGYQYRRTWVKEGPRWQLWVFGTVAGLSLAIVGFVPVTMSG